MCRCVWHCIYFSLSIKRSLSLSPSVAQPLPEYENRIHRKEILADKLQESCVVGDCGQAQAPLAVVSIASHKRSKIFVTMLAQTCMGHISPLGKVFYSENIKPGGKLTG